MSRESWDDYWLKQAELVATRSTCLRRKIGAVAVKDKRGIASGFNGAPPNIMHCEDRGGCLREQLNIPSGSQHEKCFALHGEMNLIIQAATTGVNLKGSTVYCTHSPCFICAKMLIGVKISRLVYSNSYPDMDSIELFSEIGEMKVTENFTEWNFK